MQDTPREGFRLSPQQKYLWTLQQATPGQPYRVIGTFLITGSLNSRTLKQCLTEIVGHHEILRTTFVRPPGIKTPFQVVFEDPRFAWSELDLSAFSLAEQQTQVDQLFVGERQQPFDFERGPLLRAGCLKLASDRHLLVVTLPALCADRVTLWCLAGEIIQCYEDRLMQQPQQSIQYADFAEWQNELLASEDKVAAQARVYWKQQQELLFQSDLVLPFERRPPESTPFEPESFRFAIGEDLLERVETLAQHYQTSMSVILLACWEALLWRLTGQADFVICSLNDGRKIEDLRSAMGLYEKYLPVFCSGGDRTFSEYVKQAKSVIAQADEWQEYFDPLAREDHTPAKDGSIIAFEFQAGPTTDKVTASTISVRDQFVCIQPFKLKLSFLLDGSSLLSTIEYNGQIIGRNAVDRISGYYKQLVANVIQQPDTAIGAISIVDADEQRHLLFENNQTDADYPDRCIHELFEEQVSKTPGSAAVVCNNEVLTFSELNRRANRVAHLLRKRGVGPQSPVALCVRQSVEMIVGLLGILKSGGAYIPLNPDHPTARLEMQLAQSQAKICLTNDGRVSPFRNDLVVIDLNHDSLFSNEATTNPETTTVPENLVYVIFTSGSTGAPKGVVVRHQNLVNYSRYVVDKLAINAPLNFATVSTISADLGNTCIFPSLISGGCLHILNNEIAMEGSLLAKYISNNSIDVLKIVPSHLDALLASAEENILPAKYLLLGGESLSWDLVKRLSQLEHSCRVINHYGPTETTIGSLTYDIDEKNISPDSLTVPIGRPIANTRVYVLDKYLTPVPQGVIGELFIGGAGVTDGYRNQPAETAARFLPDPFSSAPGARLYQTGDLVRQLPEGAIEFIGRRDHQVKVRGYRVELAEVEATLQEHRDVRQAVVLVPAETDGNHLVAYLTTSAVKPPTPDELRHMLAQKLPNYMIPSAFIFLESFPLTANGKLNRGALPAPNEARPELQKVFVAPRTSSEKELAEIWSSVLKLKEVGINDDFFELGGHSLLATQVVARVRKAFQIDLPVRSLFESPTIAEFAERIERATDAEMSKLLTALEALSEEDAERLLEMEKSRRNIEGP